MVVIVSVELVLVLAGLGVKVALVLLGSPVTVRLTEPVKPLTAASVIA